MRYRQTRGEKLLALLRAHKHKRVPLPEIMQAAGAQFGARILELRRRGFLIENLMERTADGQTHSWYILQSEPGETPLFPELPQRYADPEEGSWL
jgi:Helix-turn-helix domain